jgi:hypothetical protein
MVAGRVNAPAVHDAVQPADPILGNEQRLTAGQQLFYTTDVSDGPIPRWSEPLQPIYPRYSKEEFAQRGDRIFECEIQPHVSPSDHGEFVATDIESGASENDPSEVAASERLLRRVPTTQTWLKRVGSPYVRRFGARPLRINS